MHGTKTSDDPAITLWEENSASWVETVRNDQIPSRVAVTNNAMLASIATRAPHTVLDIGCGEGWLCREVKQRIGSETVGLDGSPSLISAAQAEDPNGVYACVSYQSLIAGDWPDACWEETFDAVVFNFALFEDDPSAILSAATTRLAQGGAILIQTVTSDNQHDGPIGWRRDAVSNTADGTNPVHLDWFCYDLNALSSCIEKAGLAIGHIIRTKSRQDTSNESGHSMMIAAVRA